jgi:hypothetical protein
MVTVFRFIEIEDTYAASKDDIDMISSFDIYEESKLSEVEHL